MTIAWWHLIIYAVIVAVISRGLIWLWDRFTKTRLTIKNINISPLCPYCGWSEVERVKEVATENFKRVDCRCQMCDKTFELHMNLSFGKDKSENETD
jgi:hypothetical protein